MLGHCLSAQEESEQAIAAYRSALQLSPGDIRPAIGMAKELVSCFNQM
jgi:cytochrome c-type biogenesis protein CcmH/NrfG